MVKTCGGDKRTLAGFAWQIIIVRDFKVDIVSIVFELQATAVYDGIKEQMAHE
jgi:hypothetical protein